MQLRIFIEPQQGATYEHQLGMAQVAEECGFDALFRSDHFLTMGGDGLPGPTDSWTTLAGLARETDRLRLGTLLTSATFRLPGVLAVQVAEVDAMSGGRVELGLGAGWYPDEHTAYGIPFPSLGERFERLGEQLQIVTGLWTTPVGDSFSFSGRHYRIQDSPALPKPRQSPHPPIIIGGAGTARTPRLAARYADEFNVPFHPLRDTAAQYERLHDACARHGRDPKEVVLSAALVVCCGSTDAEIAHRAKRIGRQPEELRVNGAAGRPQEVVEKLQAYGEAGATRIYLQVLDLDDHDHVRLIADQVLPRVS